MPPSCLARVSRERIPGTPADSRSQRCLPRFRRDHGGQRGVIRGLAGRDRRHRRAERAGKSTLVEIISGGMRPASGTVLLNGVDVTHRPAYQVARLGLTRTYQLPTEFRQMTVLENLLVGVPGQRGAKLRYALAGRRTWNQQETELRAKARALLRDLGLADWEDAYAGSLSGGQRRILEIARALMTEPKLLVLDEPTAGVTPSIIAQIESLLADLRATGLTFLIVEHELEFVERQADRVVVMAAGRVVADGAWHRSG